MDIAVLSDVLSALVQGAGGEAGRRAWTVLAGMTARICGHGSAEAAAVGQVAAAGPDDAGLADLLARRAAADPRFAAALGPWLSAAHLLLTGDSTTVNQVSAAVTGPVIQARDVHGVITISPQPAPVRLPRPRQLPVPRLFTDRTAETSALVSAGAGQRSGLALICGAGGMGKTALAAHTLDGIADRFPGGLFYASLGASTAAPADPATVLAGWLRAAGIPAPVIPHGVDEAAALWRSLTADRPAGVLADDAASASQAHPLMPAAGLMVVTSRQRLAQLAADGARLIQLGPLPPAAAAELAGKITGPAIPGQLTALASACGHIPLAITAAAGQAAARPNLPLHHIISDLTARRRAQPPGPVSAEITMSLDSSSQQLPPETARAYRLLALCPGPDLTVPAAAAVLGTDPGTAARLAGDLVTASLLDEPAPGRFRYHDIIRDHARAQAAEEETQDDRNQAIARAIDCYLLQSARADLAITPHRLRHAPAYHRARLHGPWPGGPDAALAWLEAERHNLAAAQQAAADLGLHTIAWQFADTLWGWLLLTRDHGIWAQVCETALDSATACGDPQARYMTRIRLAALDRGNGRYQTARTHAGDALAAAQAAGNQDAAASSCEHIGLTWLDDGATATAATWFERGLTLYAHAGGNPRGEAIMRRHLARARTRLADYPAAATHLHTALDTFTGLGDAYGQAATLADIADLHLAQGTPADAVTAMEQALPIAGQAASPFLLARTFTILADALSQTGNTDQARDRLAQATQLHDQLHLPGSHQARARARELAARLHIREDQEPG